MDNANNDTWNAFDDLKIYHKSSDIASAWSVLLLDELDQLPPKNSLSLSDFLSTYSTKFTEYNSVAPAALSSEMKKLKLQRCIAWDNCLVNTLSTFRIATRATGKAKPLYDDYMVALIEACNIHDATDISKIYTKSIPTRQVLMGEVNHYNDDYDDKFFDTTDYTTFDIQNASTITLRSFITNLLATHGSVSKRR